MHETLKKIIQLPENGLKTKFDVITIGTATRDVFLRTKEMKILRDPEHLEKLGFATGEAECFALGSKMEMDKPYFTVGGGAANTAITFARQGFSVGTFAKVGDDEFGEKIEKVLKQEGVTSFVKKEKKKGTAYSTILLSPSGERTVLVYRGASLDVKPTEIPFSQMKAKWAHVVPGGIPFFSLLHILTTLKKQGTLISLNPSRACIERGEKDLKKLFLLSDVVCVNKEEASYIAKIPLKHTHEVFEKLGKMYSGTLIMTDGKNGAFVSDRTHSYHSEIFKEKTNVDRTGAGDAFCAGFISGLIRNNDVLYALRLATANATSVVEHVGAQDGILTKKEFLSSRWAKLEIEKKTL